MNFIQITTADEVHEFVALRVDLQLLCERTGSTYVDVVPLDHTIDMWVDDEGLIRGRDVNLRASKLATETYGQPYLIFGDVMFATHDEDGETMGLTELQRKWLGARGVVAA